jgi:hypothetical protein
MPNNYKAIIAAIAIALFVIVGGFFLIARSLKTPISETASPNSKKEGTPLTSQSLEKLPEPTGKVDDTVDAIINGADSEKTQAISDESDAKSAVDDGSDTTNLNNTYDQNAL